MWTLQIFDRRVHAGVLLDGVGDAMFLKRNRQGLQGRPKMVRRDLPRTFFSDPILSVDGQLSQLSICRPRTWENSTSTIGCAVVRMSNCHSKTSPTLRPSVCALSYAGVLSSTRDRLQGS